MSKLKDHIVYNCYHQRVRDGEQFIPENVFCHQISGTLTVHYREETKVFSPGDFILAKKNSLAKFVKNPTDGEEFKALFVFLPPQVLKEIAAEVQPEDVMVCERKRPVFYLPYHHALQSYAASLAVYLKNKSASTPDILKLKTKELILLLLRLHPDLSNILFNFNEPGKIDLKAFMLQHYRYNVPLEKFAYLTGRSLSSFKRDFQKVFEQTPSRWLTCQRLEDAYYLITTKNRKASEIYLDLGFENLSHFSTAFKRRYGTTPQKIKIDQY